MAIEMENCKAEIMNSLRMNADDRRQLLRRLQVKWHPDNFPGDDPAAVEAREFAGMVARIANEAANRAKIQRNKETRVKRRSEAYANLEAAMPSIFGSMMGSSASPERLRDAIESAKEAGVSEEEIDKAEKALQKMEAKDPKTKP